ncbi:MAG: hypothetical protein EOO16_16690 [Chitinophagaceae bacterium]|nr:MAG: hypothetical protein EOO16_16690 [Chitinophagaceae bacterium]
MLPLSQKIRLLWAFYRPLTPFSLLAAGVGLYRVWNEGYPAFAGLLWMKLGTLLLAFYYGHAYRGRQYYYYHNLGLSKRVLWAAPMTADLVLYYLLLIQTARLR